MAKGYDKGKALNTQKNQTEKINTSFPKNVDASPNVKIDGMVARNTPIKHLYEAPTHWNFYNELDENKKIELIDSISENGLMSPIVVWEINKEKVKDLYENHTDVYSIGGFLYMVLAGHNRVDAYIRLYNVTKDNKYLSIPAFVFLENDLDEKSAKEIIVDTNYVQRVLSTKEMEKSILYKYDEIERDKTTKGRTRDLVADRLGISPAKVEQYRKLSNVIPPIKELMYEDKLALNSVLKLVDKTDELQQWLYDTHKDKLSNSLLNKIKPSMKRGNIEKLIEKECSVKVKCKKVSIEIPEYLTDEFKLMCSKWLYEKTKRD